MVYLSPPKSTQEICVLLSFVELKGDDQNCVLKQRNIGTLVHCSTLVLVLDWLYMCICMYCLLRLRFSILQCCLTLGLKVAVLASRFPHHCLCTRPGEGDADDWFGRAASSLPDMLYLIFTPQNSHCFYQRLQLLEPCRNKHSKTVKVLQCNISCNRYHFLVQLCFFNSFASCYVKVVEFWI